MVTKETTVRLREDQIATIKELKINISKWTRDKFDEEFLDAKNVLQRITNAKKEVKKWTKIYTNVLQRNTKIKQIGAEKADFLRETKALLKKSPEFLEGRIKLFKNTFGIVDRVSKESFMELLESVK